MAGVTSVTSSSARVDPATDRTLAALGRAMRQAREQGAALVRLVDTASASDGRGQVVNYRA